MFSMYRERAAGVKWRVLAQKYGVTLASAFRYVQLAGAELRGIFIPSRQHLATKHQQKGGDQ
jgi:hypothetical protein